MSYKLRRIGLAFAVLVSVGTLAKAEQFSAKLNGLQEVGGVGAGQTGAIFTSATGTLHMNVSPNSISYRLSYSDTSAPVTQAHIHFGKKHVGGGIIVFFCSNLANPPPDTQPCPANGGTVSGTLKPASVIGPTAQNINPGDFDALLAALKSRTAYANVHTTKFGAGEIRGQIRRGDLNDDDEDED